MRIRTVLVAGLLAAPLSFLAAPAATAATPPNTGCAVGWQLSPTFGFLAGADNVNHDDLVCVKNSAAGLRAHDNTAAATSGWEQP